MNKKEYNKQYYSKNKDRYKRNRERFKKNNPNYYKEWSSLNRDKFKNYQNKFYSSEENLLKRRKHNRDYHKKRIKKDPFYRLKHNMRRRLTSIINANGLIKTKTCMEHVGCSLEDLKMHLQKQFKEGMSWNNYGKWHVDHIVPLRLAKTEEELKRLFHYTNLQPLWAKDNLKKQGRYEKN